MRFIITLALLLCCLVTFGQKTKQTAAPSGQVAKEQAKANKGDTSAMRHLGMYYYYGIGTPRDYVKAREWLTKAANKDNTEAMMQLAIIYEEGQGVAKEPAKAVEWMKKAATKGNTDAMNELGDMYEEGVGVPKNLPEAVKYYRMAADKGNTEGMISMGLAYMEGYGVKADQEQALQWLQKAVEKGDPAALRCLADYYEEPDMGNNCTKAIDCYMRAADMGDTLSLRAVAEIVMAGACPNADMKKVMAWMQSNAVKGFGEAAYFMARFHVEGKGGMEQSLSKAMDYFIMDADARIKKGEYQSNSLKNLFVLYNLGKLSSGRQQALLQWLETVANNTNDDYIMAGMGYIYTNKEEATPKDYTIAMDWSMKAANKGNATGYYNVGYLYANGLGVAKNSKEGFSWLMKAAKKGDKIAMGAIADFYEKGEGVPKDLVKAQEWKKKSEQEDKEE